MIEFSVPFPSPYFRRTDCLRIHSRDGDRGHNSICHGGSRNEEGSFRSRHYSGHPSLSFRVPVFCSRRGFRGCPAQKYKEIQ